MGDYRGRHGRLLRQESQGHVIVITRREKPCPDPVGSPESVVTPLRRPQELMFEADFVLFASPAEF